MLNRTILLIAIASIIITGTAIAEQVFWGYTTPFDNLWSNPGNWAGETQIAPHDPPAGGEASGDIGFIWNNRSVVINSPSSAFLQLRIQPGALVDLQSGGTLDTATVCLGYSAGSSAEMKISGGNYYSASMDNSSPRIRLGFVEGSDGILTITSGTLSAGSLMCPYEYGATGKINLYGGLLELRVDSSGSFMLNDYGRSGGSMDLRAPGKLTLVGDQRAWRLNPAIARHEIYSSDPATIFAISYDGNKTTLQGITSRADLNKDNSVNLNDFYLFATEWNKLRVYDNNQPNPNRVIFAPKISPITVDGTFGTSEWANASEWAPFGKWFPAGQGLSSKTKARYAWNDSANLLYIAIESNEPDVNADIRVGGLMGDLTDPKARPNGCWQATEIYFQYNGSSVVITNPYSDSYFGLFGITTGIVAAQTFDGTTLRMEIATPIYRDWCDSSTRMTLAAGMDIYTYANILSDNSGTLRGDSQCAEHGEVHLYDGIAKDRSSAIRLLNALPASCSDVPDGLKNYADFDGDCHVDMADLGFFAGEWLN